MPVEIILVNDGRSTAWVLLMPAKDVGFVKDFVIFVIKELVFLVYGLAVYVAVEPIFGETVLPFEKSATEESFVKGLVVKGLLGKKLLFKKFVEEWESSLLESFALDEVIVE